MDVELSQSQHLLVCGAAEKQDRQGEAALTPYGGERAGAGNPAGGLRLGRHVTVLLPIRTL